MEVFGQYGELRTIPNLVVALGNFDGVHVGHQELIERSRKLAEKIGGASAVFTFDPHPLKILRPNNYPPLLLTKEDKINILGQAGADIVVVSDFCMDMADLEPKEFVKQVIVDGFNARIVVIGYNYSFGKGGRGTPEMMARYGQDLGFDVEIVPPVKIDEIEVSSSRIRQLLLEGKVEKASRLLGYAPFLRGTVVRGLQIGRKIGIPTANLDIPPGILVPANGVYLAKVTVSNKTYFGVANIGNRPTINKDNPKNVEIHIFDFENNIYDVDIKAEFLAWLRAEKRFEDLEQLTLQIAEDVCKAKELIKYAEK